MVCNCDKAGSQNQPCDGNGKCIFKYGYEGKNCIADVSPDFTRKGSVNFNPLAQVSLLCIKLVLLQLEPSLFHSQAINFMETVGAFCNYWK